MIWILRDESHVMNLTLVIVRLLFISHHEVKINISGKMTESSIQSLWQPSQNILTETVSSSTPDLDVVLPALESLPRVVTTS